MSSFGALFPTVMFPAEEFVLLAKTGDEMLLFYNKSTHQIEVLSVKIFSIRIESISTFLLPDKPLLIARSLDPFLTFSKLHDFLSSKSGFGEVEYSMDLTQLFLWLQSFETVDIPCWKVTWSSVSSDASFLTVLSNDGGSVSFVFLLVELKEVAEPSSDFSVDGLSKNSRH